MSPAEIEAYLHRQIPISAQMNVRVVACDASGATLAAPLAPNRNHRETAFGGSVSAVAILAGWTWLHAALVRARQPARLVIQRNQVEYLAPIRGEFTAHCDAPPTASLERLLRTFARHGRARIHLTAELTSEGARVATFTGEYVVLPPE